MPDFDYALSNSRSPLSDPVTGEPIPKQPQIDPEMLKQLIPVIGPIRDVTPRRPRNEDLRDNAVGQAVAELASANPQGVRTQYYPAPSDAQGPRYNTTVVSPIDSKTPENTSQNLLQDIIRGGAASGQYNYSPSTLAEKRAALRDSLALDEQGLKARETSEREAQGKYGREGARNLEFVGRTAATLPGATSASVRAATGAYGEGIQEGRQQAEEGEKRAAEGKSRTIPTPSTEKFDIGGVRKVIQETAPVAIASDDYGITMRALADKYGEKALIEHGGDVRAAIEAMHKDKVINQATPGFIPELVGKTIPAAERWAKRANKFPTVTQRTNSLIRRIYNRPAPEDVPYGK